MSFSDSTGSTAGQGMFMVGSFQRMPASEAGAYPAVTL